MRNPAEAMCAPIEYSSRNSLIDKTSSAGPQHCWYQASQQPFHITVRVNRLNHPKQRSDYASSN